MKLSNPILKLKFLSDDLPNGHQNSQIIDKSGIIARSISISYQLMSNLKSSSNQAKITILGSLPVVQDIITTEGDIEAILCDGDDIVFNGFLSTSYSWAITDYGETALSLTLEDVGTRKLQKVLIDNGVHLFECPAEVAVNKIATEAGIKVSNTIPPLIEEVTYLVEAGKTCKELLTQLFYEIGYVYFFTKNGELSAYKIDCTGTENVPLIDKDKLYSVGGNAISLSKQLMQYAGVRVSYQALGKAENYLIYRNTTNQGSGHPYCYLPLEAGQSFDGNEVYTKSSEEDVVLPRLEAVNAASETDLVGSNKIVSISNLKPFVTTESGYINVEMKEAGGPYIEVSAHNSGYLKYHITRLDAYADIIYEKSTNIIRAASVSGASSKSYLEETLEWIHDKETASKHANLVAQFNKNSGTTYSFYSTEDLNVGDIVKITDTVHSGLMVSVLVNTKVVTDESNVASFSAIAIETFNFVDKVFMETLINKKPSNKGEDGKSYSIIIHSNNGSIFRLDDMNTTLFCQVLMNNIDITELLEDWRFSWSRTTNNPVEDEKWNSLSKAIGHKTIEITNADCLGRTVFSCSVEL